MKVNSVLNEVLENVKPRDEEIKEFEKILKEFITDLRKRIKKSKLKVEVSVGGSFAKKTIMKKDMYDIDIFLRFDKKYEDISKLSEKLLRGIKKTKIHGSRDYFNVKMNPYLFLEIIPVTKVKKPEEAKNITDLSFFHVNYVNKRFPKKVLNEIILTKSFCHANNCYGAESYIKGFSGYGLELLVYHYKSFLKFVKEMSKVKDKVIIDTDKKFKNKQEILFNLNSSKLQSPIVLIDPTYKQRNALAGLSQQTLDKFKENCKKFLKNPSGDFFEEKDIKQELERKYKDKLNILTIKTSKQPGDIAGTKSKRFFEFFVSRLEKEFKIKVNEFDYNEKKNIANLYFVVNKKKEEIKKGPPVTAVHNLTRFKKAHKNAFIKKHIAYAKIKHDLNLNQFMKIFLRKDKKIIKEMCVKKVELIT